MHLHIIKIQNQVIIISLMVPIVQILYLNV